MLLYTVLCVTLYRIVVNVSVTLYCVVVNVSVILYRVVVNVSVSLYRIVCVFSAGAHTPLVQTGAQVFFRVVPVHARIISICPGRTAAHIPLVQTGVRVVYCPREIYICLSQQVHMSP